MAKRPKKAKTAKRPKKAKKYRKSTARDQKEG